jgi:hypothetical protein
MEQSGILDFSPCDECDGLCLTACPENAFSSGDYMVSSCEPEMQRNRTNLIKVEGYVVGIESSCDVEKFCRACELSCPVHSKIL